MHSLANMSKKVPAWSREFDALIRAIGECKSKAEEDQIIQREVEVLKPRLKAPSIEKKALKELLVRLLYVEMLGHDASWGHVKALQACSETNLLVKKVAYLACSQFLDNSSDLIILVVNTIQRDLKSDNHLIVCCALSATCRLLSAELISAVLPTVTELLKHPKELVRKKAIMAVHRFEQLDPDHDGPLHNVDTYALIRDALRDKDVSVMCATLCAVESVAARRPQEFKHLVPSLISILKQVAEHRLPKAFDYHRVPAPFIQLKLLRLLALLGQGDKAASENMFQIVGDTLRRASTSHTIGNAIICETVRTITTIYPNQILLRSAAESVANFLKSSSHNLRYMGIDSLACIVRRDAAFANEHQMAVIACLEDPDESLKSKTLQLLHKMTKPSNVEVITEKMMEYLRTVTDDQQKLDAVTRIHELAERFAPDTQWFLDIMNQVFELGGEVVPEEMAQSLVRLLSEGSGQGDAKADAQLRAQAVHSHLRLLNRPNLPDTLLKVVCWTLAEFGTSCGQSAEALMERLASLPDTQSTGPDVRAAILAGLTKLLARMPAGASLPAVAEELLQSSVASHSLDLQQRALEALALQQCQQQTRQVALAQDAQDVDLDPALPWLDGFVAAALADGAAPYLPEAERASMGVVRPSAGEHEHEQHELRFAAYEAPQSRAAPIAAPVLSTPTMGAGDFGLGSLAAPPSVSAAFGAAAHGLGQAAAPQLALKTSGAGRWGPAQAAPPPAASSRPAASPLAAVSSSVISQQLPATSAAAQPAASTSSRASRAAAQPVNPAHAQLAASLFGDSGGAGSRPRAGAARRPSPAAAPQAETPPVQAAPAAAPDLLGDLFGLEAPMPAARAAPAAAPQHADPFAAMEGLSGPQPASAAAAPPAMDLLSLSDALPSQPAQAAPPPSGFGADLLGFGAAAPSAGTREPAGSLLMGMPGQQPPQAQASRPRQPQQGFAGQQQMQKALGGSGGLSGGLLGDSPTARAPMAARGTAAVETAQPKRDPFADLLG